VFVPENWLVIMIIE